jgi:hypothetical protein
VGPSENGMPGFTDWTRPTDGMAGSRSDATCVVVVDLQKSKETFHRCPRPRAVDFASIR